MKNIINQKPSDEQHGRTLYTTKFVLDSDIKNKEVLDIGCGFGWFELNALKKGCKRIVGTEITGRDLEVARDTLEHDGAYFKVGSAIDIPFPVKSFDTVVSWEVIEHIPKGREKDMFKEVNRVLRSGGAFYLSTPNRSFVSMILDPAWWLIGHRHYTKSKLTSLATTNGFRVGEIKIKGGWWEIICINNLYVSKWDFRRKPFFQMRGNLLLDKEYNSAGGFTNIFVKCRKPKK